MCWVRSFREFSEWSVDVCGAFIPWILFRLEDNITQYIYISFPMYTSRENQRPRQKFPEKLTIDTNRILDGKAVTKNIVLYSGKDIDIIDLFTI